MSTCNRFFASDCNLNQSKFQIPTICIQSDTDDDDCEQCQCDNGDGSSHDEDDNGVVSSRLSEMIRNRRLSRTLEDLRIQNLNLDLKHEDDTTSVDVLNRTNSVPILIEFDDFDLFEIKSIDSVRNVINDRLNRSQSVPHIFESICPSRYCCCNNSNLNETLLHDCRFSRCIFNRSFLSYCKKMATDTKRLSPPPCRLLPILTHFSNQSSSKHKCYSNIIIVSFKACRMFFDFLIEHGFYNIFMMVKKLNNFFVSST